MKKFLDVDAKMNGRFDPEAVPIITRAFDEAWQSLQKSGAISTEPGQAEAVRERLAQRIIELARLGERDRRLLRDNALLYLTQHRWSWRHGT